MYLDSVFDTAAMAVAMALFELTMFGTAFFAMAHLIRVEKLCEEQQPLLQRGTRGMIVNVCQSSSKIVTVLLIVAALYWTLQILLRMYRGVRWCCCGVLSVFYPHQD